jgi:AcrR family transcriptional regulator
VQEDSPDEIGTAIADFVHECRQACVRIPTSPIAPTNGGARNTLYPNAGYPLSTVAASMAAAQLADGTTDMDEPVVDRASVRQRLLDAADELFYHEGLHRVHIDRVIEKAGVPVDTLRDAFGSTDELIRTYLRARHTRLQDAVARELPRYNTPRERLVGVFEIQGQSFVEPGFHGCALVTASAEALPGEVVEEIVTEYRDWVQNLFFDLAFAAEVPHPEELAEQLVVLFDGAGISAWLDRRPSTVNTSRAIAEALIDAALQS